jgi:hypothetical protein
METVNDIIKDSKFNDFLQEQIDAYNKRPVLPIGQRYKRTPFDGLKDEGKFNVENISAEFVKIANRETNLSRAKRDAITSMVFEAARKTVNFREEEAKTVSAKKQKSTKRKAKPASLINPKVENEEETFFEKAIKLKKQHEKRGLFPKVKDTVSAVRELRGNIDLGNIDLGNID